MKTNNLTLRGKVALVTGGAQRIGAVIVRALHAEGMSIALTYRNSRTAAEALRDELNMQRPRSVHLFQCDLLVIKLLPRLVERVMTAFGRLDALVNNASTFYPTAIGSITEAVWDDLIGANLKAPLFLTQAAAPHLAACRGAVVNISDIHGVRPLKQHAVYCAAKAGLIMLTKSLARDLGPEVRVNSVAPGAVLWPERGLDELSRQRILSRTPLRRQGMPEDVARAVVFLLRDAAYTTGDVIYVDGGQLLGP
ncbi:MAG: pteridine reductase [Gammaproteobacteria bacterium]|jgi:pteridine reductase